MVHLQISFQLHPVQGQEKMGTKWSSGYSSDPQKAQLCWESVRGLAQAAQRGSGGSSLGISQSHLDMVLATSLGQSCWGWGGGLMAYTVPK